MHHWLVYGIFHTYTRRNMESSAPHFGQCSVWKAKHWCCLFAVQTLEGVSVQLSQVSSRRVQTQRHTYALNLSLCSVMINILRLVFSAMTNIKSEAQWSHIKSCGVSHKSDTCRTAPPAGELVEYRTASGWIAYKWKSVCSELISLFFVLQLIINTWAGCSAGMETWVWVWSERWMSSGPPDSCGASWAAGRRKHTDTSLKIPLGITNILFLALMKSLFCWSQAAKETTSQKQNVSE